MFADLMERRAKLIRQRDEAEIELDMEAESAGLQDQIKLVLAEHAGEWMTVADVRDYANDMGFDFRQYKANPLASIKTTLKRLADSGYAKTSLPELDGSGTRYMRDAPLQRLKMLSDLGGGALERGLMSSVESNKQKADRVARIRAKRDE